ncbi:MAG: DUF4159 domain-containing protein [Planctomycetota bacterium]
MTTGTAVARRDAAGRAAQTSTPTTGDKVQLAIDRAIGFLETVQRPEGRWLSQRFEAKYPNASSALGAYTLLQVGKSPDYWRIGRVARAFKDRSQTRTAFARAMTLLLWYGIDAQEHRREIEDDIRFLTWQQAETGGWGEPVSVKDGKPSEERHVEPVASYFALLAMDRAVQSGKKVNFVLWNREEQIGSGQRNEDGGWPYLADQETGSSLSDPCATAARLASLYRVYDVRYLETSLKFNGRFMARCGQPSDKSAPIIEAIQDAWQWLDRYLESTASPAYPSDPKNPRLASDTFFLMALSDAARSAGRTHVGNRPWPGEIAGRLISMQQADGSWGGINETCFGILALLNCSRPVVLSRLVVEPDADWHRTPREAQHLAHLLSQGFGEEVSWQAIHPGKNLDSIFAAPLLLLSAHDMPPWSDQQRDMITKYVHRGGTIVASPCCSSKEFLATFRLYLKESFPRFEESGIANEHPLARMKAGTNWDGVAGFGDSCRTSIFLLNAPACCAWQQNLHRDKRFAKWFDWPVAIALYATLGRSLPLRPESFVVCRPAEQSTRMATVATVRHDGDWWIKPAFIDRLSEMMIDTTGVGLKAIGGIKARNARRKKPNILWLTGTRFVTPQAVDRVELKAYLAAGGTLVASPACGNTEFDDDFRSFASGLFGADAWQRIPEDDPLLTGSFFESDDFALSPARFRDRLGSPPSGPAESLRLFGLKRDDRWAVLYCPFDLASAVLDESCPECVGYEVPDANAIARNLFGYAAVPMARRH